MHELNQIKKTKIFYEGGISHGHGTEAFEPASNFRGLLSLVGFIIRFTGLIDCLRVALLIDARLEQIKKSSIITEAIHWGGRAHL